jgi:NADH-quinone oxidoreductase subunit N
VNDAVTHALAQSFRYIVPEGILGAVACLLFVGGAFVADRKLWGACALAGLAGAASALVLARLPGQPVDLYATPFVWDRFGFLVKAIAIGGGVVLVLVSWDEVPDRHAADYQACLLIAVAGLCLTGIANDLVALFLSLELISIPTYVLLYLPRHDEPAQEAAVKYFLLSIFSSGLLLFGFSYFYGLCGTTNLPALFDAVGRAAQGGRVPALILVAIVMTIAGLSFRMTAVPFHFYAPDVYQGAATPAVALLAFVPKAAGFIGLIRVLGLVSSGNPSGALMLQGQVPVLLWILAVVSMSLGNVLGLLQSNVKRLLAYSSVAHAGYMLIGLAVAYEVGGFRADSKTPGGVEAVLFYLVAYGAMTIGAFGVLGALSTRERPVESEDDLIGLSRSHPGVALLMGLFLFSLIGIPFTAGFWGKLLLLFGALDVRDERAVLFRWLAAITVVNTAIGGWYYLRILAKMYLHNPIKTLPRPRATAGLAALWLCAIFTLAWGFYPDPLVTAANRAVEPTRQPRGAMEQVRSIPAASASSAGR